MTTNKLDANSLTLDELQPWVRRAFDEAYHNRTRLQASREDVAYGWIACLLYLHSYGSFQPTSEPSA